MSGSEEMVTIPKKKSDQLVKDSEWLSYLNAAGVDNWEGIDQAFDMMKENENGNDEN